MKRPRIEAGAWLTALVLAAPLSLVGCAGSDPEPPAGAPPAAQRPPAEGDPSKLNTGYKYRFDMIAPGNDNFAITEREVYLYFWPDTARVNFRIENRLGTVIKIFWDDCRFTNTDGITYKCIHRGITYDKRFDSQDYTQIPGLGRYADWIAPVDLLQDPQAAQNEGMRLLFPTDVSAESQVGKTFSVTIPMEIENRMRTYRLVFKVDSVIPPS